jgi:vacuolar-type H+-ATPase subunit I/STV1
MDQHMIAVLGPRVWWLQRQDNELKQLALRTLQIKPNAAGMEVVFSLMSVLKPLRRNRLSPKKLAQMTKIRRFYNSTSGGGLDPASRTIDDVRKLVSSIQKVRLVEYEKKKDKKDVPDAVEVEAGADAADVADADVLGEEVVVDDDDDEEPHEYEDECELLEGVSLLENISHDDSETRNAAFLRTLHFSLMPKASSKNIRVLFLLMKKVTVMRIMLRRMMQ